MDVDQHSSTDNQAQVMLHKLAEKILLLPGEYQDLLTTEFTNLEACLDDQEGHRQADAMQAFLLQLSDALRPLVDAVAIQETVTRTAMDYFNADRCYYSEIVGDQAIVRRDAFREDAPSVVGVYPLNMVPIFKEVIDAGRPFVVQDAYTSPILDEPLRQLLIQMQVISFIDVPVIKDGLPVGVLSITQTTQRKWTDFEVNLAVETAERTWEAVERTNAQEALRVSEEKYRTLFEKMDQGFCILQVIFDDHEQAIDHRYIEVNPVFEQQNGLKNAVGKTVREMVPYIEPYWLEIYGNVALTSQPVHMENYVQAWDQWFEVEAYPIGDPQQHLVAVLFSNVTERKRSEETLRKSESVLRSANERFRASIDSLSEAFVIFTAVRKDGEIVDLRYEYVNEEACKTHQLTRDQLVGSSILKINPLARENGQLAKYIQVIETGQPFNGQLRVSSDPDFSPSKAQGIFDYRVSKFGDGIILTANDVTEQVQREAERQEVIKEREIHHRLTEQRELERQSIAREIHDGPIQTLSSLLFNLQSLREAYPDPALQLEVDNVKLSIKSSVQELRQVMYELRPPSVIQFGISKAIQSYTENLREHHPQITWNLELADDDHLLPQQTCLTLFRVYQEAINNIIRHSQAAKAWITIEVRKDELVLEIRDNGKGFVRNLDMAHLTESRHFGLAGIAERVVVMNANLEITSQPGEGTVITIKVPIKNDEKLISR